MELLENMELSRKEKKELQSFMNEFEVEIPKSKNADFIEYLTLDLNEVCNHFSIDSIHIVQSTNQ